MVNNPDQKPLFLAQVGFSFNDVNTSLAGVRIDRSVESMTTPRVVILEPETDENNYANLHEAYGEIVEEAKEKLGENSKLLHLVRGDIYKPESLVELPPLALLVLENVLSDPYYHGVKDFEKLAYLMGQAIVNGGVILTLDSKITYFSDEVKTLVQGFLTIMLASENFEVVLSLLDFEWGIENTKNRDSQKVKEETLLRLEKLGVVDQALRDGLETLRLGVYHCLVLQKI